MAVIAGMTNSFKKELLEGDHELGAGTFAMALYRPSADITPETTIYDSSGANEVSGEGYSTGGKVLTGNVVVQSGSTSYVDFDDPVWTGVTFSNIGGNDNRVRGALIYTVEGPIFARKTVAVLDFGLPITVNNGTFTVRFPAADANDAIIRIK